MRDMSDIKTFADYYDKFFYINKDGRFVGKLYKENGEFVESILIPSEYYPLNDKTYKVFHYKNCTECTDETILKCFDSVKPRSGYCYSMADELSRKLTKFDIEHKIWCGWLFVGAQQPVHHCWVTVGENDESVLDLQDVCNYFELLLNLNKDKGLINSDEDKINLLVEFNSLRTKNKISNVVACDKVGVPSVRYYYVGCQIGNGDEARKVYNCLIDKHPDHPLNMNIDKNGMTKIQQRIYRR